MKKLLYTIGIIGVVMGGLLGPTYALPDCLGRENSGTKCNKSCPPVDERTPNSFKCVRVAGKNLYVAGGPGSKTRISAGGKCAIRFDGITCDMDLGGACGSTPSGACVTQPTPE